MSGVTWWERDIGTLLEQVYEDGTVVDTLTQCGLLNYLHIRLMHSTNMLLDKLVKFWDREAKCLIIQEDRIDIKILDIYFLAGLPMLGVIGDTTPKLTHGVLVDDLC